MMFPRRHRDGSPWDGREVARTRPFLRWRRPAISARLAFPFILESITAAGFPHLTGATNGLAGNEEAPIGHLRGATSALPIVSLRSAPAWGVCVWRGAVPARNEVLERPCTSHAIKFILLPLKTVLRLYDCTCTVVTKCDEVTRSDTDTHTVAV